MNGSTHCSLIFVTCEFTVTICIIAVTPAVLADDSTMISTPLDSSSGITTPCSTIDFLENLAGHDSHALGTGFKITAGNTTNTFAVIVYGSNCSCHMSTMTSCRNDLVAVNSVIVS